MSENIIQPERIYVLELRLTEGVIFLKVPSKFKWAPTHTDYLHFKRKALHRAHVSIPERRQHLQRDLQRFININQAIAIFVSCDTNF